MIEIISPSLLITFQINDMSIVIIFNYHTVHDCELIYKLDHFVANNTLFTRLPVVKDILCKFDISLTFRKQTW